MANPRKFSDKLEIIRRKEEEANAAFVQIMREVSDARKGGSPVHPSHLPSHQQNTWIARNHNQNDFMKMRQIYKGGSLPNVNLSPNPSVNQPQGSYPSLNDGFNQPQQAYGVGSGVASGGSHVRRSMDPPSGPIFPSRKRYPVTSPYRNNLLQQPSFLEEQTEAAPSLWRRTCSDSAIQQTLQLPPKSNTNGSGSNLLPTSGARIIPSQQTGPSEAPTFARSPPVSLQYVDSPSTKNHLNIQADTSSLPDLSNLSIPSPIQNPIDAEQEGKLNNKQREQQNHFQAPYRIPPRRVKQVVYPREFKMNSSTSDIIDTLQREQKPNMNSFPEISVCSSNVTGSNPIITHSVSAPLSPVTPPYFWNSTPISPLATGDIMQSSSAPATDLQQQLFQIQNENLRNNGIGNQNPPPYSFPSDDESYHSFCSNNYLNDKQNVYRNNSGPAHLSSTNSKTFCDHQLESALMRVKAQQGGNDIGVSDLDSALLRSKTLQGNELSQAQLNSVRVALDPLDFEDVQMLSDNAQLVDQSAEEQFRLERASYQ